MAEDRTPRTISSAEQPPEDEGSPPDRRHKGRGQHRKQRTTDQGAASTRQKEPGRDAKEHPISRLV